MDKMIIVKFGYRCICISESLAKKYNLKRPKPNGVSIAQACNLKTKLITHHPIYFGVKDEAQFWIDYCKE